MAVDLFNQALTTIEAFLSGGGFQGMNDTVQPEISYPWARQTPFDARRFAITTSQALIRRKAEAVAAYAAV
jgi:hypothetical protein